MNKFVLAIFLLLSGCSNSSNKEEAIEVNFSPNGGAAKAIVREIDASKNSIQIQAYSFTNPQIGGALLYAHDRGVKIEAILDRENLGNPNSLMKQLSASGIPIFIDDKHQIAHNKVMIIDHKTVVTGSMNFTKAGDESNAENSLIIKDNGLAARYIVNWNMHKSHSERFNP